ncbi:MAG: SDR family NAD(P)-dependent oxidoreductase [Syntrophobacterales bacterium]
MGLISRTSVSNFQSILITGAAGGIGREVSLAYAEPGVHLFLGDNNASRLEEVVVACRDQGAAAHGTLVDVTHRQAMAEWILGADVKKPLDLVISLAGISKGSIKREETIDEIRDVLAVNLEGLLNTIEPILPLFRERRHGQIAFTSSYAGFRGFPVAPSYCATKAAIRVFGEGLRARVKRDGVGVSVIIPGFVRTPMTDANPYFMPFRISAPRAAAIIKRGLANNKPRIRFPRPIPAVVHFLSLLPPSLVDRFVTLK